MFQGRTRGVPVFNPSEGVDFLNHHPRCETLRGYAGWPGMYGPDGDGFNNFGTRSNCLKWCAALGIVPKLERVFTSPAGTVIYEVYSVDGSRTQAGQRAPPLNQ